MTALHTPGPWFFRRDAENSLTIYHRTNEHHEDEDEIAVAEIMREGGDVTDDDRADARLIAAAPELLDALKALIPDSEQHAHEMSDKGQERPCNLCGLIKRGKAAIAKAVGA